jgi:spoIIIJ-associated protein
MSYVSEARSTEKTGKTVQEAIASALAELNTDESKATIEVLEEGNKGLFGLIGGKLAKVRVTLKETGADVCRQFLYNVFDKMGIDVNVDAYDEDETLNVKITGKDVGIVISRRGETLDALQYLSSLVVNKGQEDYRKVLVDTENYRQKREETLVNLADRLAGKVIKYKKNITLEPMNPYERRIIHSALQNNKFVKTYSIGDEPNRKVVITLK